MNEGPSLFTLMQRLAETPSLMSTGDKVKITAVISDLLFDSGGLFLNQEQAGKVAALFSDNANYRDLVLITCHLLYDTWFRSRKDSAQPIAALLIDERLRELARLVKAKQFIVDPERREELARFVLAALGYYPAGETETKAKDRLTTLDSVARVKLIEKTREAQERARKLREEMARREAEEAASKMSRE